MTTKWFVRQFVTMVGVLGLVALTGPAWGDTVVIDNFSSYQSGLTPTTGDFSFNYTSTPAGWAIKGTNVGTGTVAETGLTGVLGGRRATSLITVSGLPYGEKRAMTQLGGGKFSLSTDDGVLGRTQLGYPGAAGVGLNWNATGLTSIDIAFDRLDYGINGSMPVDVTLKDNGGRVATATVSAPENKTAFVLSVPVASLTAAIGFNWAEVDFLSILLNSNSTVAADFQLSGITANTVIPEPTALLVWGLVAFVGVGATRRLRAKRSPVSMVA